jgi:spore coat protein CotF
MISITDGLQALYNSNMREKTPLELERENRLLRQQITQLTNNWNELEEWIKKNSWYYNTSDGCQWVDQFKLLNKMKKIKEGK